jgi:hypothetical protein
MNDNKKKEENRSSNNDLDKYIKKKDEKKLEPLHIAGKIKIPNEHNDSSDSVSVVSTITTSTQNTSNYHQKKKNGEDRLAKAIAKARSRRSIIQQEKDMNIHKVINNLQRFRQIFIFIKKKLVCLV